MPGCIVCGSNRLLIRHHRTYNPEQIVILCATCHYKLHHKPWQFSRKWRSFFNIQVARKRGKFIRRRVK